MESTKVICAADRKRSLAGNGGSVTAPPTLRLLTVGYNTHRAWWKETYIELLYVILYGAGVSAATATGAPWPLAQIKNKTVLLYSVPVQATIIPVAPSHTRSS